MAAAKSALPDYDFSTGAYPLSKKDREHLASTQAYSSTQIVFGTPVEEQCFIVPNETPKLATLGNKFQLPVTIIFNRLPSRAPNTVSPWPERTISRQRVVTQRWSCPRFSMGTRKFGARWISGVRTGFYAVSRQQRRLRAGISRVPPKFRGKALEDSDWKAVSMACRIPVAN